MTELMLKLDDFIHSKQFITDSDSLLVAVSGGIDSMFLLHYLISKNYKISVAHCNFDLRGDESEGDERFVKRFCKANSLKLHVKKFQTALYAGIERISIQMAAREIRYFWFNDLCESNNYTKIVTAHHKTDNAETILLNMVRGTGLKGLEGIAPIKGNKIRPLLCLSREEIESFVSEKKIKYRNDSSNLSDKYYRNRLRHHVLPELKEINPSFENTLQANADIISQANGFINYYIENIKKEIITVTNDSILIDIEGLVELPEPKFILFNLLTEFEFNAAVVNDIFDSLKGISGKLFFSSTHRLIINRDQLIIERISKEDLPTYQIYSNTINLETPHHSWVFEISNSISSKADQISNFMNVACFDLEKISFPLTIRLWQKGDKIIPLGMKGHKKVSDILIDKKLSLPQKEKIWVVISKKEIIWVGGLVINDDFKITTDTKKVLRMEIK